MALRRAGRRREVNDERMRQYQREWRNANKEHLREKARQAYARLTAKPKRPKPKSYAEIKKYNRAHPLKGGWRR